MPYVRILMLCVAAALAIGLSGVGALAAVTGVEAASPQPAEGSLKPGLSVVYYRHMFRHVEEIPEWAKYREGKPGKPLHSLNYRTGLDPVLTSGAEDGVGAHIKGFIKFDTPGTYTFATQSNDGVRLFIGGKMILEDPDVHADRYSDPVEVEIKSAGWYPIEVLYFERKNTSTLQLYWLQPDDEEGSMALVPAEAYGY